MHQTNNRQGFTIIELMLSTVFIGSLLLVITLVVMQATSLYNTGLTIKEVNAVSRVVVRDMQQTIMNSDVFALRYYDDTATNPVTKMASRFSEIQPGTRSDYYTNNAGGRFCTGTYSYAWNTGRALKAYNGDRGLSEFEGSPIQFIKTASGQDDPIKFIKIRDTQKNLCRAALVDSTGAETRPDRYLPSGDSGAQYQNVFGAGNNNLVLYKISIDAPGDQGVLGGVIGMPNVDIKATAPYYTISLVVGTQSGDEIITTNETCSPPAEATVNESEYCAINKIDFVARSGAAGK